MFWSKTENNVKKQLWFFKIFEWSHYISLGGVCVLFTNILIGGEDDYFIKRYNPDINQVQTMDITAFIQNYPNYHGSKIKRYVKSAIIDTLNIDFESYKKQVNKATATWFTDSGAVALKQELQWSGLIDLLTSHLAFMSAVTLGDTTLVGTNPELKSWLTVTNVLITFRSKTGQVSYKAEIVVHVQFRDFDIDPTGLGISYISVRRSG